MTLPLYHQVMGQSFTTLAPELRALHSLSGARILHGQCTVKPAQSRLAHLVCLLMRLPTKAATSTFEFELRQSPGKEVWIRRFPDRTMRSVMQVKSGRLVERIGPVRFTFDLAAEQSKLTMRLVTVSVCGIDLPKRWAPTIWGREHGTDGKFYFDAGADWGWLGHLAAYSGWLEVL
jgi:uncharacterized protein DUF4166